MFFALLLASSRRSTSCKRESVFAISFKAVLGVSAALILGGLSEARSAVEPLEKTLASTCSLRGYGTVTASFAPGRAEFLCENEEKAGILLGKMLADLFWDAPGGEKKILLIRGRRVPVYEWAPYGKFCVYRDGRRVQALGAQAERDLVARLKGEHSILTGKARFEPDKPYPVYLDFYDLKSFRVYTGPMGSAHKLGLESHWPFIKRFGLGGICFQGVRAWRRNPAEGVYQDCDSDYEVREAERRGGMAVPCPGGGEEALWAYNRDPASTMQPSPRALLGAWGGAGCAGGNFQSEAASEDVNTENIASVMDRYKNSPAVGGWHLYAGAPGVEMGMHDRTGKWWDYSPAGQENFRAWLRDVKGYTLVSLGQRWRGDPAAFRSWEAVSLPDALGFYGSLDANALLLNQTWFWKKADVNDVTPPSSGDASWVPFNPPPSQKEMFFPWGDAFYKTKFDAQKWLSKNEGRPVFLVCSAYMRTRKDYKVWLNGKLVGIVAGSGQPEPFSVNISGKLNPGVNELIVRIPSGGKPDTEGKILGPVFLTSHEPRPYPYLGREGNARYVDLCQWQAYSIYKTHLNMLQTARTIDPDRPMILSPGSSAELADDANELAVRFGMGVQHTGREAWYHPWWAGYGLVAGYYGTSEPGGTARGETLTRMLGWILFDADSAHTLFWNIEDYILEEQTNGWFSKNKRNIQLFGKYLREKPKLALFRTAENALLGERSMWDWDVGRGELQRAHFDNAYASERELSLGLLKEYPVLMDCGNQVFDYEIIQNLTKYVKEGGVFIALHNTGIHTPLDADAYPLGALSGFKITSKNKHGKIRFGNHLPVFKGWEGREFVGNGIAMDFAGNDVAAGMAVGMAVGMTPVEQDVQTLARWEDGSTAIGYRKLGKGVVLVLGSSFWRNARDSNGTWVPSNGDGEGAFFEKLLVDLGVHRTANASIPSVWARKYHTKNGLQDWLLAFNSSSTSVHANVSVRLPSKPETLWNLETNQPVKFTWNPEGWATVEDVALEGYGVVAFGVKRAGMVEALADWWKEKTTYWKQPQQDIVAKIPVNAKESKTTVAVSSWHFFPDRDGRLSSSGEWKEKKFDEASGQWRTLSTGPWNFQCGDLKDYTGVGLYRAKVNLPKTWMGKTITLRLYSMDLPLACAEAEFFINGKSVACYHMKSWSQTLVYNVNGMVQSGENLLAVYVKGKQGVPMGGIMAAVWFQPEVLASEEIPLCGEWKTVKADYLQAETVRLPGVATGKYLTREVEIPASWKNRPVYLHLETPNQWLGSIVINGHPINYNTSLHPFGSRAEVNISLHAHFGTANTIELWPYATIPLLNQPYPRAMGGFGQAEAKMAVTYLSVKKANP